jgi:hypothetical protein
MMPITTSAVTASVQVVSPGSLRIVLMPPIHCYTGH